MKLWLDDVRPAPVGFVWVKTAEEAIAAFATGDVTVASLDHDLEADMTGYDVLAWVEKCVATGAWYGSIPTIYVHSANPPGRLRMELAVKAIHAIGARLGCDD